jgi:pyridoxamine 5'-phosphate oxidase family protein
VTGRGAGPAGRRPARARNATVDGRVAPGMSVFTEKELEYLAGQRLGRIATVGQDGQPHVVPTSFRHNQELDAIEVGGMRMSQTKKVRDVRHGGRATIVVDDVLPPWQPRMIEIRGTAEVVTYGGKAFGDNFDDTIVRIHPRRIISFGINPGEQAANARSVNSG